MAADEVVSAAAPAAHTSVAKFNRLIVDSLTAGPKRVKEIYQIAQDVQPQDCTSVPCPHRKKASKSMEWQHEIQRQLARLAANREGLWHLKANAPAPIVVVEETTISIITAVEAEAASIPVLPSINPATPYTGDPFTVTAEGLPLWATLVPHYMDNEEFVKPQEKRFCVPNNFDEFYSWRPDYVLNWVKKRLNRFAVDDEVEDWTQDLLIHLRYLPQGSKYRLAGANNRPGGCEDVIETYNPLQQYGASERRFRNYVNNILGNKFLTVQSKRQKNPVLRAGNVPFGATADEADSEQSFAGDEFVHAHSDFLTNHTNRIAKQHDDRLYTNQFKEFVAASDSTVYPALEALESTGTIGEAAKYLNITDGEFTRFRNRLKQLAECFENGTTVPKQRRPYKKRAKAAGVGGSDSPTV